MVYTCLGSPGTHLYAFLRGVHSPGLPWESFVCIFTWCTLAWLPLDAICMHFTWCTLAWAPLGAICIYFYVVYIRLASPGAPFVCIFICCTFARARLGTICMHFYVVYTRLGSPGNYLYAFLRGVDSPGLRWRPFVCIFAWCTLAWARLGAICMHFYMVYTRLGSPGGNL